MDRKRITRILARAEAEEVSALSAKILDEYDSVIVKEPAKTLSMIKLRDPVRQGEFYIGEVIVCEAAVEIEGVAGASVVMGDDTAKALDMAIIDAAIRKNIFADFARLEELEKEQNDRIRRENAMIMKTTVNFESMDQETPDDVSSFKKA
ncbi:MAG TPA: phosphonate C-P lyase system protein PhnG [Bacillota bacterium]|nr:phosphonate C-P lyase system protein PhnG [Bacillota bacterium]HQC35989.1 phosphonate C-P lyase system protein PhnG [Bacillota bacterium]